MITKAPIIPNAVMLDAVIGQIQNALIYELPWLDAAFGRAQKLVKEMPTGKRITTPNVYCGGLEGHGRNDYMEVSPDRHIGNFSFFLIEDPETIDWERGVQMSFKAPFSLVFWFDLNNVFGNPYTRNTEYLKAQILETLNGRNGFVLDNGRIRIDRCYEDAKNIYRGFTLDEVDNQFLMHPYGGFRFEGVVEAEMPCTLPDINR